MTDFDFRSGFAIAVAVAALGVVLSTGVEVEDPFAEAQLMAYADDALITADNLVDDLMDDGLTTDSIDHRQIARDDSPVVEFAYGRLSCQDLLDERFRTAARAMKLKLSGEAGSDGASATPRFLDLKRQVEAMDRSMKARRCLIHMAIAEGSRE
ncbi:MAG: hypothetical protein AAFV62_09010 [Pseudomonadota bacterium]